MTIYLFLLLWLLTNAIALDWLQTLTIAKNPHKWEERNPLLGKHPSVKRVNIHFSLSVALMLAIAIFASREWAMWVLGWWLVIEILLIWNNNRIGIKPSGM